MRFEKSAETSIQRKLNEGRFLFEPQSAGSNVASNGYPEPLAALRT